MVKQKSIGTYYVFVASPRDMDPEREAVHTYFERYNNGSARHRGLRFEVIDFANCGSIGVGRPQALINAQTLFKHRDHLALVITLMGQRFGTPSGKAGSCTVEEFELAMAFHREHGWPEIKCFFREGWNPEFVPLDDEAMTAAAADMKKVKAFRASIKSGVPPIWYASFPDSSAFPARLQQDLDNWLNAVERPWNSEPVKVTELSEPDPEDDGPWWDSYFELLEKDCARLPLNLLKAEDFEAQLQDVFVPLDLVQPPSRARADGDDDDGDADDAELLARQMARGEGEQRQPVFEALAKERALVLVGDLGSGKTTLVDRLTQRLLTPGEAGPFAGLLPVRIVLRRVEVPATGEPDTAWLWQALERDIADRLQPVVADDQTRRHEAARIKRRITARLAGPQGLLLMLDGLDEVSEADGRRERLLLALRRVGLPRPRRSGHGPARGRGPSLSGRAGLARPR